MARTKEGNPDKEEEGLLRLLPPRKKGKPKKGKKADQNPVLPRFEPAFDLGLLRARAEAARATTTLRASKEDETRLSSSSDEAVLNGSLSAQSEEQVSASAPVQTPSAQREQQGTKRHVVMSGSKETTTVMTLFAAARPSGKPLVNEELKDPHLPDLDYSSESSNEVIESASRAPTLEGEQQALEVVQTTALDQEPSSIENKEEKEGEENRSDSPLSIQSDLIMNGEQEGEAPEAVKAKPVLNAQDIMSIVERKDISIKKPVPDHNPQRKGLDDNLFDFEDALCDYTSDGGTIRINQGLATLMLIAATAEAPNRLLMESKRAAFEQVTAQAQDMLEKQRHDYEKQCEAIEERHQELAKQHHEHLENMRKQNELLQAEVMKARGLYSQAYQQFEVTLPSASPEESRALKM